jgi:hypothetical protein
MAGVPARGQRFGWIFLVCGLVFIAASARYVVVAIRGGWSLTVSLEALGALAFGLFWVVLYRRRVKSRRPCEVNQPGPN